MGYVSSRQPAELPAEERSRRIRRRTVQGAVVGGLAGVVAAPVGAVSLVPPELLASLGWLGLPVVVACGGLGTWLGVMAGRESGARDAGLEPGETVLSQYGVRPPVVDGRPTEPSDDRFALRVTDCGLQLWDGTRRLWSHPWSEVRLSTVKGSLLLVHHGDQEIAELLAVPEGAGWDALLLGAQRLRAQAHRR
ncbi:hypothetical protein [Streptomyces sp. R44]|uniref:Uncharacterized protein n=1 Tax=Streptomyces sp. R44 TaxID=3238633 RepID=A0AB39T8F2_9ACTN